MPITESRKLAIKKYRQGNGLEKSRETQAKQNLVKAEYRRLSHVMFEGYVPPGPKKRSKL